MTTLRGSATVAAPACDASAATSAARAASADPATFRLMKPGPATSTEARRASPSSRAATFAASSRGFCFSALAAASAPFDWKSARSGRSDGVTRARAGSTPSAAKAAPTASPSSVLRSVILFVGRRRQHAGVDAEAAAGAVELGHLRRHVEADEDLEIVAAGGRLGARDDHDLVLG